MKKIVLLILMVIFSLPVPGKAAEADHPELNRIKAEELKQFIDKKGQFILIDSRDSGKYNEGHIEGAINIHFDPSGDPNARKMTLMAIPTDNLIIVYGDNEDEKTSVDLALELYDMGCNMDNLKILSGGITQWKKSGYPLIKTAE